MQVYTLTEGEIVTVGGQPVLLLRARSGRATLATVTEVHESEEDLRRLWARRQVSEKLDKSRLSRQDLGQGP